MSDYANSIEHIKTYLSRHQSFVDALEAISDVELTLQKRDAALAAIAEVDERLGAARVELADTIAQKATVDVDIEKLTKGAKTEAAKVVAEAKAKAADILEAAKNKSDDILAKKAEQTKVSLEAMDAQRVQVAGWLNEEKAELAGVRAAVEEAKKELDEVRAHRAKVKAHLSSFLNGDR